jgi:hypothetical protein
MADSSTYRYIHFCPKTHGEKMKFNTQLSLITLLSLSSMNTFAEFEGKISFTEEQIKIHMDNIINLTSESDICLKDHLNRHLDFFKKYGISAYYGEKSAFSKMSQSEKLSFLKSKKLDPKMINELVGISCVGLALRCLERGFKITNQESTFQQLLSFVKLNDVDGTSLQYGLSKLGWKTLYWNPNTDKNKFWDFEEKLLDPKNKKHFRGFHEENYVAVKNKKRYFMNSIDDASLLVNFGNNEPSFLKSIPFYIATAHMGYHVFPGSYGTVVEGHASRAITDESTIESAPFNPLDNHGAPNGKYRSGIMSIPPGYLN